MRGLKLTWLLFPLLTSCAFSMHEVHVSDFSPYAPLEKGGEVVKAVGEQSVIFWFTFDTNYVDEAYKSLQGKCPTGQITSISSQLYTELGFLSWKNKLLLQGVCRSNNQAEIKKLMSTEFLSSN